MYWLIENYVVDLYEDIHIVDYIQLLYNANKVEI